MAALLVNIYLYISYISTVLYTINYYDYDKNVEVKKKI
jgi:hypothetical protein